MAKPWHHAAWIAVLAVILLAIAVSCSSDDGGSDDAGGDATATTAGAGEAAFPVTIENCGETVTIDEPPTAAVTMNQGATEIMLALGLEEQMAGTAYLDDAVSPELTEAFESVPVLSDEYPSEEVLLGAAPDFVYGSYASAFDDEAAGDRATLEEAGIGTYLSPNDCRADEGTPVTFDDVYDEIREIGTIFGVADEAEALIADSEERIAAAAEGLPEGVSVFWFDSGTDVPTTAGCCGAPAMIMEALGTSNVFADLDGGWGDGSWETAVAADPGLIVLVDASWNTIDSKTETLAGDPQSTMTAVQDERFVTVPFSATTPGVRNVEAVEAIAEALREQSS